MAMAICGGAGIPKNIMWDNGKDYGNLGGWNSISVSGSMFFPICGEYSIATLNNTVFINGAAQKTRAQSIDLTPYTKLKMTYYAYSNGGGNAYLGVTSTKGGAVTAGTGTLLANTVAGNTYNVEYDVSALNGTYFIGLTCANLVGGIKKFWLE